MSTSIEVRKINYQTLISQLMGLDVPDKSQLELILSKFGERIGDFFVTIDNEYYGENGYNPLFEVKEFIQRFYGLDWEEVYEVFKGETVIAGANAEEIAEELGLLLPETEE